MDILLWAIFYWSKILDPFQSENDAFYFMNEHLSKSDENPTIETIENVTMKRIQGTIYLDKW